MAENQPQTNGAKGLISPSKIAYYSVKTTPESFEKMVQWHRTFFGAEVVSKMPNAAFLRFDDEHHRTVIIADPVNHGMSTSMYYFDLDKNEYELQVDNFDTTEEAHEWMRSQECQLNPIGVDFVPEEFVKCVRSGQPEAEIKRPLIGKRQTRWENSIYFKESEK